METRTRGMRICRRLFVGPLGAILAALTLAVPATAAGSAPTRTLALETMLGDCSPGSGWGTVRSDYAARVLELVNAHRASVGAPAMKTSPTLTAAAVWKALHMAAYSYMSHDDPAPPVARTAGERLSACGYPSGWWGENIAYGYTTPETVVQGWLNSSGHRKNIENPTYRATGIGAARSVAGQMTWAQDFGAYDDSTAAPTPPPPPPASPALPKPSGSTPAAPSAAAGAKTPPKGQTASRELSSRELIRSLPHAGRRFAAAVIVRSSGGRLTAGQVGCRAGIGTRHLRVVVNAFKHGAAVCAWRVPRWAHGRLLRGLIHVRSHRARTSHLFGRRVR